MLLMTADNSLLRSRLMYLASASLAFPLASCGGGGGGVASLPPPPVNSTPSPAPAAYTITAPARGTVGANPTAPVTAQQAGPNFSNSPSADTPFRILQTVVWMNQITNGDDIYPDAGANASGGTIRYVSGQWQLTVPDRLVGSVEVSGQGNLDWTRAGYWEWVDAPWDYYGTSKAVFVFGYETPSASVPTTGVATFNGTAQGSVFYPVSGDGVQVRLSGNASFTANFGARTLTGTLTGMMANGAAWNSVAFDSTITGNVFSGITSVTTAPGGAASLGANAAGTLEGRFFGPAANEAGAVWTLYDGTKAAIGTLAGKRQ